MQPVQDQAGLDPHLLKGKTKKEGHRLTGTPLCA